MCTTLAHLLLQNIEIRRNITTSSLLPKVSIILPFLILSVHCPSHFVFHCVPRKQTFSFFVHDSVFPLPHSLLDFQHVTLPFLVSQRFFNLPARLLPGSIYYFITQTFLCLPLPTFIIMIVVFSTQLSPFTLFYSPYNSAFFFDERNTHGILTA